MESITYARKKAKKIARKSRIDRVIQQAKAIIYKDIYIPKNLRGKIKIIITKNGNIIIKKK